MLRLFPVLHRLSLSKPLGQGGGVSTSRSAVAWCGPGTQPVLAASSSARRWTSPRSSSRKRSQSARRSSETNSPGSSGLRAGGVSGCSLGPGITPHPCVESVDNSGVCEPQTPGRVWALKRRRRARLYRGGPPCVTPERRKCPTKWGDAQRNPRKEREPSWRPGADRPAWGTGTRRRYERTAASPHSCPAPLPQKMLGPRELPFGAGKAFGLIRPRRSAQMPRQRVESPSSLPSSCSSSCCPSSSGSPSPRDFSKSRPAVAAAPIAAPAAAALVSSNAAS
jgi:hypothetical protein